MVEDGFRDLQNKAILVMVMVALSFLRCEGVRWSEPGCVRLQLQGTRVPSHALN
jgi:hypothetical protein